MGSSARLGRPLAKLLLSSQEAPRFGMHHSLMTDMQTPPSSFNWMHETASGDTYAPPPPPPAPPKQPFYARKPVAALAAVAIGVGAVAGAAGGGVGMLLSSENGYSYSTSTNGVVTTSNSDINPPAAVAGTVESAANIIGPSVVTIAVTGQSGGGFGQSQAVSGTGSGVVIRSDGYILTNNHVVSAAVNGGSVSLEFSDGSTAPATITGTDPASDLAVIKVSKSGLTAAVFADSEALKVGQTVIAVGAPLGLSNTVTEGIVSTLHRPVTTGDAATEQSVIDAIQTDAAINPGNSGGPLVDLAGRVVGINSAIASLGSSAGGQSGNIGVGFSIPANDAVRVSNELISSGKATRSQLGVGLASTNAPASRVGATISQVTPGGPAAQAGLKSGDVITKIDDRRITDAESLIVAIRSHVPGSTVTVTYERGGSTQTTKANLTAATS